MEWTNEDYQLMIDLVSNGKMVLVADTRLGIPTIHDFPGTRHIGFGFMEASNQQFSIEFTGGGAMSRTPSGHGYSVVNVVSGSFDYPFDAVLNTLEGLLK